jgi:hypothetical protein
MSFHPNYYMRFRYLLYSIYTGDGAAVNLTTHLFLLYCLTLCTCSLLLNHTGHIYSFLW